MTDKLIAINFEDLKEGDPVLFFGVHVLRWNFSQMGEPSVAITSVEDDTQKRLADLEQVAQKYFKETKGLADFAHINYDDFAALLAPAK